MEACEDIVREMREMAESGCRFGSSAVLDFADRIDAAYKREIKSMCNSWGRDMWTATVEIEKLREENLRLKSMRTGGAE